MSTTSLKAYLLMLTVLVCSIGIARAKVRADLQPGYKVCPERQLGRIVAVETDGIGCYGSNGQDQWPCFLYPGKDGIYRISFTHDQPQALSNIRSSIHAFATYRGIFSFTGVQRIPFLGEVNKDACPFMQCPVKPGVVNAIEKVFTVPSAVRLVEENMEVEFKLTDKNGDTIICFITPVINR